MDYLCDHEMQYNHLSQVQGILKRSLLDLHIPDVHLWTFYRILSKRDQVDIHVGSLNDLIYYEDGEVMTRNLRAHVRDQIGVSLHSDLIYMGNFVRS
jgi:hypothetical protein